MSTLLNMNRLVYAMLRETQWTHETHILIIHSFYFICSQWGDHHHHHHHHHHHLSHFLCPGLSDSDVEKTQEASLPPCLWPGKCVHVCVCTFLCGCVCVCLRVRVCAWAWLGSCAWTFGTNFRSNMSKSVNWQQPVQLWTKAVFSKSWFGGQGVNVWVNI